MWSLRKEVDHHESIAAMPALRRGGRDMKTRLSYSRLRDFRNCPKLYFWKYVERLETSERVDAPLSVGRAFHKALQAWYLWRKRVQYGGDVPPMDEFVDIIKTKLSEQYRNRGGDENARLSWHLVTVMFDQYIERYGRDRDWRIIAVEMPYEVPIINPETKRASPSFWLMGLIDIVVESRGLIKLGDHKTLKITGERIDKLLMDLQCYLYGRSITIDGQKPYSFYYNLVGRSYLRPKQGESDVEWEDRLAKAKRPKACKRKHAETDDEFRARLTEQYRSDPHRFFHREEIILDDREAAWQATELWDLCQDLLATMRRGLWRRNPDHCFYYGRPCAYFPLCRAQGSSNIKDNLYQQRPDWTPEERDQQRWNEHREVESWLGG